MHRTHDESIATCRREHEIQVEDLHRKHKDEMREVRNKMESESSRHKNDRESMQKVIDTKDEIERKVLQRTHHLLAEISDETHEDFTTSMTALNALHVAIRDSQHRHVRKTEDLERSLRIAREHIETDTKDLQMRHERELIDLQHRFESYVSLRLASDAMKSLSSSDDSSYVLFEHSFQHITHSKVKTGTQQIRTKTILHSRRGGIVTLHLFFVPDSNDLALKSTSLGEIST